MYKIRDSLVYKADTLYILEDLAIRLELIRMHYNNPLASHFVANKTLDLIRRKY